MSRLGHSLSGVAKLGPGVGSERVAAQPQRSESAAVCEAVDGPVETMRQSMPGA